FQIGRVDDAHHDVGHRLARLTARQHTVSHLFIQRLRVEAVHAGQVDDAHRLHSVHPADFALDRHTRVVAYLLTQPRDGVEYARLAHVRIARQHNRMHRMHNLCRYGARAATTTTR